MTLRVSGVGNFDRINAPMLADIEHWKSYTPTSTFSPADDIGYRGEKTFEQALIATQAGPQVLPALQFSWFDPSTRRYESARTAPLSASIVPLAGGPQAARASPPPANVATAAAHDTPADGLLANHADTGGGPRSLMPDYYRPGYLAAPSGLALAFLGAWAWTRRRERVLLQDAEIPTQVEPYLRFMEEAGTTNDAGLFFKSARAALQVLFAPRWHLKADAITRQDVEHHLGANHDVSRLFNLADQAAYAGVPLSRVDFAHWKRLVDLQIHNEASS
jgi:hypothetical protein